MERPADNPKARTGGSTPWGPGLGAVGVWVAAGSLGSVGEHPVLYCLLYGLAFLLWALAAWEVVRRTRGPRDDRGSRAGWPLGILAVGLLLRIVVMGAGPSDDVHRYIWEGRVQRAGFDPYVRAPADPALRTLAEESPHHEEINHPTWPAIYPPLATLWHRFVVRSVALLKATNLLLEALLVLAILGLLRARGLPGDRVLVYAWNPLPVYAFAQEAHHDVLALSLLLVAIWAIERGRERTSAVAWAGSVLAKGFGVVTLPALVTRVGWRAWLLAAGAAFACLLPFHEAGTALPGTLLRFGGELHYNDSVHAILAWLVGENTAWTRVAVGGLLGGAVVWSLLRHPPDPILRAAWLLGALLLLLPTVHPWYITVIVPFLCFRPWVGWGILTGTCILPSLAWLEIAETGRWTEWNLLKIPEYGPLFLWLAWRGLTRRGPGEEDRPRRG